MQHKSIYKSLWTKKQIDDHVNAIALQSNIDKAKIVKTRKLLFNTIYPTQGANFFILKFPPFYPPNLRGRHVPVDASLKNIIQVFWRHKLFASGWDEGYASNPNSKGFISFSCNIDSTRRTLKQLLQKPRIAPFKTESFREGDGFVALVFKHKDIAELALRLGTTIPDLRKAYEGGLVFEDEVEFNQRFHMQCDITI